MPAENVTRAPKDTSAANVAKQARVRKLTDHQSGHGSRATTIDAQLGSARLRVEIHTGRRDVLTGRAEPEHEEQTESERARQRTHGWIFRGAEWVYKAVGLWNPPGVSEGLHRRTGGETGTALDPLRSSGSAGLRDDVARRVLWGAALVGLVRFLLLGEWSLWIDEAYTLADSLHGEAPLNPLGYWLFGWIYGLGAFRPDEFVLRMPSAVMGWLCIPLSAWALTPFVGRRAAAIGALFVALSPWHVYWSQNARFYTLAQAACLVGTRSLFLGLRREAVPQVLLGTVMLAVASGCHPSAGLLFGATLGVPWLLRWTGAWPFVSGAANAEGSTPVPAGEQPERKVGRPLGPAWRTLRVVVGLALLVGLFWAALVWSKWNERQGVGDPLHLIKTAGYLVSPGIGAGFALGAWRILRGKLRREGVLLWIACAGLGGALGASVFARVSAQYVFVLLPHVAALAALPVAARAGSIARAGSWFEHSARRSIAYVLLIALPLGVETGMYFTVRHGDRPQWRAAYRYVFDHREGTDLILGMEVPVGEYYWNPTSTDLRNYSQVMHLDHYRSNVAADWARYGRRMWLIVNESQLEDWSDDERADFDVVRRSCERVVRFPIPFTPRDLDVDVYYYDGE